MSELNNPLFDDQREFLERQKEEYKNALLSDVTDLKDQSQKVGKTVLMAGGALVGIYLLGRAFSGSGNEGSSRKKRKAKRLENPARFKGAEDREWISSIPDVEDDEPLYSAIERTYPAVYHPSTGTVATPHHAERNRGGGSALKAFFQSDLFRVLEQQLAAVIMVYLTKMIEQHLHPTSTTTQPVLVEETVIDYHLQPDQSTDAQPQQL